MALKAVIFDLDGVLTDTAEYHYLAWKQLADEMGLPFDRTDNEQLRGVSRRESLLRILAGRPTDEETLQAMMARKNDYYRARLKQISPADLLPGVVNLLAELDAASIPYAVASVSRNAQEVVARLGLANRLAVLVDGHSPNRSKPAPDLFRCAAAQLNLPPSQCLVIEDAAAGIEGALAAGMPVLALGPAERFETHHLLAAAGHFTRYDNLAEVQLADLQAAVQLDPGWTVSQDGFNVAAQHHVETIFTIGNGYFASRGSFEEGHPGEWSLTLGHGIFDDMPLSFTELANLPNWLDLRLQVDGYPFGLHQGRLLHCLRRLDLRHGILRREVRWQAPHSSVIGPGESSLQAGQPSVVGDGPDFTVIGPGESSLQAGLPAKASTPAPAEASTPAPAILDITFERFASYTHQHVGAVRVLVTAVNRTCQVTVQAGINGHVANDDLLHWRHLGQGQDEQGAIWLHSRTRSSGIELGMAASLSSSEANLATCQDCPGQPTLVLKRELSPGQSWQIDKLVSLAAGRDQTTGAEKVVGRALAYLNGQSYDALKLAHAATWDNLWRDLDVIIEGDGEAQLAMRFSLFQLQIAAPQEDDRVSIGAKTLSGLGYRGHVFWDTEIFILPFFSFTQPRIARNLLMYRYHTLAGARRKAAANGYSGAQYAWESAATGDEVTPPWLPDPANPGRLVRIWTGDIELHITADVAYAINQYWRVTGDDEFMFNYGAEIILATACFWRERVELEEENGQRRYAIRDVVGPDEYHDHVDNNAFTNRMVQWHLETALHLLDWLRKHHPEQATVLIQQLGLTQAQLNDWRDIIKHLIIPHQPETGLIIQFENFFELQPVDWPAYEGRSQSMQTLLGIEGANKHQVVKQADVIMLLCLLRQQYDQATWQVNWDTYMPLTDHTYGSSLGPSFHAWAACEMNRPDEAYEHFMLAARADLYDVRGNAGDGIHAASAGGLWQAIAFGFAGLRLTADGYTLSPRLPAHWRRLAFKFYRQGQQQVVDIQAKGVARKT